MLAEEFVIRFVCLVLILSVSCLWSLDTIYDLHVYSMTSLIRSHAYLRACKIFIATSSRYFRDNEVELQKE